MTVFVVVFSNYSPAEVDSIWTTEALAQARVDELNDNMWQVEEWTVRDSPTATPGEEQP